MYTNSIYQYLNLLIQKKKKLFFFFLYFFARFSAIIYLFIISEKQRSSEKVIRKTGANFSKIFQLPTIYTFSSS